MRRLVLHMALLTLGAGVALVLLEAGLRFMPVSMGLYRTQQYDRWPLQSYEPARPYTYSISWAMRNAHRGKTNNYGHIAPFDFQRGSGPIIVMGDSFVESQMNDYTDTLQGQLGARLGEQQAVYGLGVSGLSTSDYLALSRLARDEFKPTAAVVVISDGDIAESVFDTIGHYYFSLENGRVALKYHPLFGDTVFKRIRKSVGEVWLYRYLEANLGFSRERFWRWLNGKPSAAAEQPKRDFLRLHPVVDYFLDELPIALAVPPRCVVFLLDSDRYAIYKPELATKRKDPPDLRNYFIEQARARGYRAVDLDPLFRSAYADRKMKFDYWPFDRHWNAVGHGMAADLAYRLLSDEGDHDCLPRARLATQ